MTWKRRIRPGEKVGLKLTQAQRDLLLESLVLIPREVEEAIRSTPSGEPLMFTLDELDDLAGHVAAAANHAEDQTLRGKLDRIYKKIDRAPRTGTDEPSEGGETGSVVETILDLLAGEPPLILPMPSRSKKGEDQYPVKLTDRQREALICCHSPAAWDEGEDRGQAPEGTQTVGFTRKELEGTAEEVDTSLGFAPGPYKKRLDAVLGKLEDLLDALEESGPSRPGRKPAEKTDRIYQFKVTLKDIKPPVWRRVQVPDCTLGELHEVIQIAMGWTDSHLHQFVVKGNPTAPGPRRLRLRDGHGGRGRGGRPPEPGRQRGTGRSGSGTSTTSATAGSTTSSSSGWSSGSPGPSIPGVSAGHGPARPRIAAGRGATPTSSQRWPTPSTRTTGT